MEKLGFIRSTPAETGTPGYDPRDLMKLYIYGYFYAVRSSRKLARECHCNIEVMWLLCSITDMASEVKKDYEVDVLETVADKGYESPEDHANALASGIIPNVIQRNGGSTETVTFEYVEHYISDDQINSAKPENLRLCLESGVIPTAYEGILSNPCIREVKSYSCGLDDSEVTKMTQEEMMAKAAEGYFVRDPERNIVYCPMGQTLRQKAIKRNGFIRYCNSLACTRSKNKCTKSSNKEVDFNKALKNQSFLP